MKRNRKLIGDDVLRLEMEKRKEKEKDSDYQSIDETTDSDSSSSGDCQLSPNGELTADYVIQMLLDNMLRFIQRHPHMTQNDLLLWKSRRRYFRSPYEVLFSYKSPYFDGSIDVTRDGRDRLENGAMVNDSVINFYLRYMLTQYIDSNLLRAGVDLQKAQDMAGHPEKLKDTYSPRNADEEVILPVLRPLCNRFAVATSFIYPQLRRLHSKEKEVAEKRVRSWILRSDLLHKDFILLPVFYKRHWSLSIVCQPWYLKKYIEAEMTVFGVSYTPEAEEEFKMATRKKKTAEEEAEEKARRELEDAVVAGLRRHALELPPLSLLQREKQMLMSVPQSHRLHAYRQLIRAKLKHMEEVNVRRCLMEPVREYLVGLSRLVHPQPYLLLVDSYQNGSFTDTLSLRSFMQHLLKCQNPPIDYSLNFKNLVAYTPSVTQQENQVDCGIFLLMFAEIFMHHSDRFVLDRKHSTRGTLTNLFPLFQIDPKQAFDMRRRIVAVIDDMTSQFAQTEDKEKTESESEIECLEVVLKPKRRRPAPKRDPATQRAREKAKAKKAEQKDADWRSDAESADEEDVEPAPQRAKKRKTDGRKESPKPSRKSKQSQLSEQWVI